VFAFAMIIYEIIAGSTGRSALEVKNVLSRVAGARERGEGKLRSNVWVSVPEFVLTLIVNGLAEDSSQRPTFRDILYEFEVHEFRVLSGVDTDNVIDFTLWVEESRTTD
jgi:hypothetical protein